MPTFLTIDGAIRYIKEKLQEGLYCEQTWNIDGSISVNCRLAAANPAPASPRPIERTRSLSVSQGQEQNTFQPEHIGLEPEKLTLPHELRDYQRDAVNFAMEHKHALIEIPTGRGKTLTSLGIVNEIMAKEPRFKTLVVVPTQVLLQQWITDGFKPAGISATGVSSEGKAWGNYTVTTYQSAIRNLHMLSSYQIVIFDEVHHLFSPEYIKILYTVKMQPYLIGLTATIREYGDAVGLQNKYFPDVFSLTLTDFQASESSRIPIEIAEIPVTFSTMEREDYDRFQASITRANRNLGPMPDWIKYAGSPNQSVQIMARAAIKAYAEQKRLLTETPEKLDVIVNVVKSNPGQFVIFSDTIFGIETITEALNASGIPSGAIYSGVSSKERQRIITGLRDKSVRVLVGGNAITEGLDIPDMSNAILSSLLVKSSRTYVQRVGRVLRPGINKHVKLYLIYVEQTLEERNAMNVRQMLGDAEHGNIF